MVLRGGILYVSDSENHAIRAVDLAEGEVSTFAGDLGTSGSQDGSPFQASFNYPVGMALWESPTEPALLVADISNHVMREVRLPPLQHVPVARGTASTFVGRLGAGAGGVDGCRSDARFNQPHYMALTADQSTLYVTDYATYVVRSVDVATGAVSTLTGSSGSSGATDGAPGTALLDGPIGLALSGDDATLYLSEDVNFIIRAIDTASGTVSLLAGSLTGGAGSVDGAAGDARFAGPKGMVLVCSTLYVADAGNHAVRAVSTIDGSTTTLAGALGVLGAVDDTAGAARFNNPHDLSASADGSLLYVADTDNHAVRLVHIDTGEVTTLAGLLTVAGTSDGTLTDARFNMPVGLQLRGGILYCGEYANNAIRAIHLAKGMVSTLSGSKGVTGAVDGLPSISRFSTVLGLALLESTEAPALLVGDAANHVVRKVALPREMEPTPSRPAGTASTFVGSLAAGSGALDGCRVEATFNSPQGLALSASGSTLYVSDQLNHAVRALDVETGAVTTLAGDVPTAGALDGSAATAQFSSPAALALSPDQSTLFVADYDNGAIRAVDTATGEVSTFAGLLGTSGAVDGSATDARFTNIRGLAISCAALYTVEHANNVVRVVDAVTGATATLAGSLGESGWVDGAAADARFLNPSGIALSEDGRSLFVSDTGNDAIRRVDITTGYTTTLVGLGPGSASIDGGQSTASFSAPQDIQLHAGILYVTDDHSIRAVDVASGRVSTLVGEASTAGAVNGPPGVARLSNPRGMAVHARTGGAVLLVADSDNHLVREVALPPLPTLPASEPLLPGTVSTLAGSLGAGAGGADSCSAASKFDAPHDVVFSHSRMEAYVADHVNHVIRSVDMRTGSVSTLAGMLGAGEGAVDGPPFAARFYHPSSLAMSYDETTLYLADRDNHVIRSIRIATGEVATAAGTLGAGSGNTDGALADARFFTPEGVAIYGSVLYVMDALNHRIRVVDLAAGSVSTLAGTAGSGQVDGDAASATFNQPARAVVSEDGATLVVVERLNHALRMVDTATGDVSTFVGLMDSPGAEDGAAGNARFDGPLGLAIRDGVLYVSESNNHAIRAVNLNSGEVSTLAGSKGIAGAADGVASTARFDEPIGLTVATLDGRSTLLVADKNNHALRSVALPEAVVPFPEEPGWVVTAAGTAGSSPGTDNGFSADATFHQPRDVVFSESRSTLFMVDTDKFAIRSVNTITGEVATLAGSSNVVGAADGIGASARFDVPYGLALSSNEQTLYVTDFANHALRVVDVSSGAVSTLAGELGTAGAVDGDASTARFANPADVVYACDTLYVSDHHGHCIRMVDTATGAVTTLAGTLGAGSGAVDGAAADARFYFPARLALSGDGTLLYVADKFNHAIRSVDTLTGDTATFVGVMGDPGSVDGTLAEARFAEPFGLALRGDTLFVSSSINRAIRVVDMAAGEVLTLAGDAYNPGSADGSAFVARFSSPQGLALHERRGAAVLYVADTANNAIRRVALPPRRGRTPGVVSTLASRLGAAAGSAESSCGPQARFHSPSDAVFAGSTSTLYVADHLSHAVFAVDSLTGEVSILAGKLGVSGALDGVGSSARFDGARSLALSDDERTLYVADFTNHVIRAVSTATAHVTTLAGSLGAGAGAVDGVADVARFRNPEGLAVLGQTLFVMDTHNHAVRTVDVLSGTTATLAGKMGSAGGVDGAAGVARFNVPIRAVAVGDRLYVSEVGNHALRVISLATGDVSTVAGDMASPDAVDDPDPDVARFHAIIGLDLVGHTMYLADMINAAVRSVDLATGNVQTVAGALGVSGADNGAVEDARFDTPLGLAAAGDALYLTEAANHVVRVIGLPEPAPPAPGTVTTPTGRVGAGPGAADARPGLVRAARFNLPTDIARDAATRAVYLTDTGNHLIRKQTAAGGVQTLAGVAGEPGAMDGDAAVAQFDSPAGCALSGGGQYLYVSDAGNHVIRMVDLGAGTVSTVAGTLGAGAGAVDGAAGATRLNSPAGLAFAASTLFIADRLNHVIRTVDANGDSSTLAGALGAGAGAADGAAADARFDEPYMLAVSPDSSVLYVSDYNNAAIRAVDIATGATSTLIGVLGTPGLVNGGVATTRFDRPAGLACVGPWLLVTEEGGHAVRMVDVARLTVSTLTGELGAAGAMDGPPGLARLNAPAGLAAWPSGLYVVDTNNHVVREVPLPPAPPPPPGRQCPARHGDARCAACQCGGGITERMRQRLRQSS